MFVNTDKAIVRKKTLANKCHKNNKYRIDEVFVTCNN